MELSASRVWREARKPITQDHSREKPKGNTESNAQRPEKVRKTRLCTVTHGTTIFEIPFIPSFGTNQKPAGVMMVCTHLERRLVFQGEQFHLEFCGKTGKNKSIKSRMLVGVSV